MKVGVITTSRADYGIYSPLLEKIQNDSFFDLTVLVSGSHLKKDFGETVNIIKQDGFTIISTKDCFSERFYPVDISINSSRVMKEFSKIFNENIFDCIFCLGDRYEMFAAVSAVIPFNIPVLHIHGGEVSEGAIDNKYRFALSQLSDYHFVVTELSSKRIEQIGFSRDRILISGSLGIENLRAQKLLSKDDINNSLNLKLEENFVLVTYHPVTTEKSKSIFLANEFIKALEKIDLQIIITYGNGDTHGDIFRSKLEEFCKKNENVYGFNSLGSLRYFSVMSKCSFLLGNSSSGIIEAASFKTPVINVGNRQLGREQSNNVINCKEDHESILNAVQKVKLLNINEIINVYEKQDPSGLIIQYLKKSKISLDTKFIELL